MSVIKKIGKVCLVLFVILFAAAGVACAVLYVKYHPLYVEYRTDAVRAVAGSDEDTFKKNLSSYIYDDSGALIGRLSIDADADYLRYEDIPEQVIHAFIAVEDRRFWEHEGYDSEGILRVCWRYLVTKGEEKHGASTITQQLARSVFLTNEVTLERKVREILLAVELEKKYSKEQILEFYVNSAYFANRCYGIEAAAKKYFGKTAAELSLSETAYLCAIPNAPSHYDPLEHEENALPRRDKILSDMQLCGYITLEEMYRGQREEIVLAPRSPEKLQNYETTYAVDCAVRYLMGLDGFAFRYEFDDMDAYRAYVEHYNNVYELCRGELYTGGYVIKTSLNGEKQELLQNTIDELLAFDEETGDNGIYALQSASTVIDNETHKVVAVVGGRSQETDVYTLNRAYQSWRQPGSSFKPLAVYAPALDQGYTADSSLRNIDVSKAKEMGLEAADLPGGGMKLDRAVEKSVNGCAWWLFCRLTPKTALSYVNGMEFAKIVPDDYYPASALGGLTYGATTVEMAGGYSTLVNGGDYYRATCLVSMKDRDGRELYREPEPKQIYSAAAASEMVEIMKGVIRSGTAASMKWDLDVEAAGKTGTTNQCKDGWFCGVTPDYAMSVWVGYDEPRILENLYGATYPAAIWKTVMAELVKDSSKKKFGEPPEGSEGLSFHPDGAQDYDSYLPGRSDDEVLSEGYTVRNYREDHILADRAEALMYEMNGMNREIGYYKEEWQKLYEEAAGLIGQIYSRKLYTQEMQKLEALAGGAGVTVPEPEVPTGGAEEAVQEPEPQTGQPEGTSPAPTPEPAAPETAPVPEPEAPAIDPAAAPPPAPVPEPPAPAPEGEAMQ